MLEVVLEGFLDVLVHADPSKASSVFIATHPVLN
jgi:hypothetical protein